MIALGKNVGLFFFSLVSTVISADSCQISEGQSATSGFLLLADFSVQYWKYTGWIIYSDPDGQVVSAALGVYTTKVAGPKLNSRSLSCKDLTLYFNLTFLL